MIQKLLCWFFGHKTVYKPANGKVLGVKAEPCLRCGESVMTDRGFLVEDLNLMYCIRDETDRSLLADEIKRRSQSDEVSHRDKQRADSGLQFLPLRYQLFVYPDAKLHRFGSFF